MLSEKWETLPEIHARIGGDLSDLGRQVRRLVLAKKAEKRLKKIGTWEVLQFREMPSKYRLYVVFGETGKPLGIVWARKPSEADRSVKKAIKSKRGFKTTVTAMTRLKMGQERLVGEFWEKHGLLK